MIQPETRFANVGDDRVAYQVLGAGSRDLVLTWGLRSHLDIEWEDPTMSRFLNRLASFCRLIRFDRRGTGISDRPSHDHASEIERWQDDCIAVLDAVGSTAPVFMNGATLDTGPLILQFVDRFPGRCSGLVLVNTTACWPARPDYPQGLTPEDLERFNELWRHSWGQVEFAAAYVPSQAKNEACMRWFGKMMRSMASPREMADRMGFVTQLDARSILPRIRVPALVLARGHYRFVPIAQTRFIADQIPGARFVELPGADGFLPWEAPDLSLDLIEEFITGQRPSRASERTVTTVMFTDIVGSTSRAAQMGNTAWRELLDQHDIAVRQQIAQHGGRFIESSGDGVLSTFDSPYNAIDCARCLPGAIRSLGLEIRASLHTGEVELREDGRIGGVAVHIGARLLAFAGAGDVLVSHTVQGMLMGSRYAFHERGVHELKGVPGKWSVFAIGTRDDLQ